MSAKHTPGPIRYEYEPGYCGELIAQDGMTIAAFIDEPSEANTRRLAACWNACDGMETQQVEQISQQGETLASRLALHVETEAKLISQRDELLEAIAGLVGCIDHGSENPTEKLDAARAAIAKATGAAK